MKRNKVVALLASLLLVMMMPINMFASAAELVVLAPSQEQAFTFVLEAGEDLDMKINSILSNVIFTEELVQDGTSYQLADTDLEYEILKKTPVTEEQTLSFQDVTRYGTATPDIDKLQQKDGQVYILSEVHPVDVAITDYEVSLIEEVPLGTAATQPNAEDTYTVTYHIDEYDLDIEVPLTLSEIVQTGESWTNDVRMPMTITGVTASRLDFNGREIPFDGSTPPLSGYESMYLSYLGLDPDNYRLTGVSWDGAEYTNNEGIVCRNAVITGERRVYDYTAIYGGETVVLPAFTVYETTSTYTSSSMVETGDYEYVVRVFANYTEKVTADKGPLTPLVIGVSIGVLALIVCTVLVLAVLAKKRKEGRQTAGRR